MKSQTAEELPPSRRRRFQKAEGELPRSEGRPLASRNLAPDEPGRDLCGKCTACIDVCLALGSIGIAEDLPAVGHSALDPDQLIAEAAR